MRKLLSAILLITLLALPPSVFAGPESETYELVEYGFGSGSTASSSAGQYALSGILGEVDVGSPSSESYNLRAGLIFTHMANVPPAPTLTNPSTNYERLQIVINEGGNPSDTKYAVAITDDNWATTRWVQSDATIGTALGAEDYLTYAGWGSASGTVITGLKQSTTYKARVKAIQGSFTESGLGPEAQATTSEPSLTFGVDAQSVTFSNLNAGNSYTDSSQSTILTTSTNAYNGYIINARTTGLLTSGGNTIPAFSGTNASPASWTGTGFGYTTDDSSLTGGTANRFTNGGPKYAGFTTASPGDPVADHEGPVTTPISNEQFTVSYRVTANETQRSGTYATTVLYIVVPEY